MAFNLGAFAGGLAKGGMSTYAQLKELERQDEELALRKQEAGYRAEQATRERERYQQEADITAASRSTYGRVGGAEYAPELQRTAGIGAQQAEGLAVNTGTGGADFDRAVAESTQGVLRENAARQGKALPADAAMAPATYTESQAEKDYLAKVRAISPKEAMATEATQLGIKAGRRTENSAQKQENALGFQQNVLADMVTFQGDIGKVLEKHFIPLYNENKLPGLADGGTAKVVPNAMGGGSSIVITGKDGKEQVVPANIDTLQMLTQKAQDLMMASSSPENYWKSKDQFLKERTAKAQETSANAAASNAATSSKELQQKISAGLFGAQAGLAKAQAGQATAHAALYNNMVTMAKEKTEAGKALKPFIEDFAKLTPEEQQGTRGQQILTEGALAAAKKSGDVTGLIAQLKKPDKSNADAVAWGGIEAKLVEGGAKPEEIAAQQSAFMARRGYAPSGAVAAIQQGINPKTKKPLTAADVADFNKSYPKDAVDPQSLPWVKQETARQTAISAIPGR